MVDRSSLWSARVISRQLYTTFRPIGLLQELFEKHNINQLTPSERGRRIWNCDETGICMAVASRKVLAHRGEKNVHETGGGSGRDYITLLACGSAIGEKLPPYILYKGKNLMADHTHGGPPGTRYSCLIQGGWRPQIFLSGSRSSSFLQSKTCDTLVPSYCSLMGTRHIHHLALWRQHVTKALFSMFFPPTQRIFSSHLMLVFLDP